LFDSIGRHQLLVRSVDWSAMIMAMTMMIMVDTGRPAPAPPLPTIAAPSAGVAGGDAWSRQECARAGLNDAHSHACDARLSSGLTQLRDTAVT
jgi:hypothetical protein